MLIRRIIKKVVDDVTHIEEKKSLIASDLGVLAKDVGETIGAVAGRVVGDPLGTAKMLIDDAGVALFGHHGPHPVRDAVSFVEGVAGLTADTALKLFNAIPSNTPTPTFETKEGSIKPVFDPAQSIGSKYHSEASLGEMSWLIYKGRMVSNPEITEKWSLYRDDETSHGFNSRTYVDQANKQVVITLEGTQANSDLSPLWLSKDGLADLEIGLGVIPPAMREGYKEFKNIVADVENKFDVFAKDGYGLSVAGHSLGGGLAQMMPGMYFIDTGKALPTMAQAGPGMLGALKLYAQEQLLAGKTIHLPSGGTYQLHSLTTFGRANEAKSVVQTFKAQDFSNVVNLITELDPVGAVNYNIDPNKDGHVGVNMKVPYLLTTREDMQDVQSVLLKPVNSKNIVTSDQLSDLGEISKGFLPSIGNIAVTRFDRHEPDQSIALWSGTAVGFKKFDRVGLGSAVYRDYDAPRETWEGSKLNLAEKKIFGSDRDDKISVADEDAFVLGGNGNDMINGGKGGDMLDGGNGNDVIYGGDGDNYLAGAAGNDALIGGKGNDIIFGGLGDDAIDGGAGADAMIGGAGNDTLFASGGNDVVCGNEGDDKLIVRSGVEGNVEVKWERNFTNFGNDIVQLDGAVGADSSLLFNFADEIRFQDMKWSQNGSDIIMTDNLGDKTASVTFKNAFDSFGLNNDKIDFKFTDGRLYLDDKTYHLQAGAGTVIAKEDAAYAGNILVGSKDDDVLQAGKGNDLLFGGAGSDNYVFNGAFGYDQLIGSESGDLVSFSKSFSQAEFSIKQSGQDLKISYQQSGLTDVNTLTINNWYAGGNRVNDFSFGGEHYKVENNLFVKA